MNTKFRALSKHFAIGFIGLGSVVALGACVDAADTTATDAPAAEEEVTAAEPAEGYGTEEPMADGPTVVDLAASDESFSTLVAAIEAAELTEVLSGEGPYTVFAPTNEAFEALPEGTLEQLLLPENRDLLTQILTYHVVPAEVMAADVASGEAPTVAGAPISIMVDETTGEIMVNEAAVVMPDVVASNGVIHVIDQVLLPPDLAL